MKVLSGPEGDGLLTNAEVLEWLKEKNFEIQRRDVPDGVVKPPSATASVAKHVRMYIESSPAGSLSVGSVRTLFERLEKYNLSSPELLMIANIRPEAYAHLTPLIADAYSRFDEDQIYEILEIVNSTLEKRQKPETTATEDNQTENDGLAAEMGEQNVDARTIGPPAEVPADVAEPVITERAEPMVDTVMGAEHLPGQSAQHLPGQTAEPVVSPRMEEIAEPTAEPTYERTSNPGQRAGASLPAEITDMTAAVQSVKVEATDVNGSADQDVIRRRRDATVTDYSVYANQSRPRPRKVPK